MAIAIAATRQNLADRYGTLGTFIGTATAAPGTSATPANESTGGGYGRIATTWSSGSTGTITGTSCTINVPASTISHIILCNLVSGNNMIDNADTTDIVFSSAGQAVVSPVFTIT